MRSSVRYPLMLSPLVALLLAASCNNNPSHVNPQPDAGTGSWQLVGTGLPSALMSVSGTASKDVFAVGSDKGSGPLVVHYDGTSWSQLATGVRADLWWVQAFSGGRAVMAGSSATILQYDGHTFTRMNTPGLSRQTIYGVYGQSPDDFYAVGSAAGREPFIWHWNGTAFSNETLPAGMARLTNGELPGLFKVWGHDDEIWVAGAMGTLLHKKGTGTFSVVSSGTTQTLFTVHGVGDRVLAVGGGTNGVALEGSSAGTFKDITPSAAPLIQGIFADARGDWATGEGGLVWTRTNGGAFSMVNHGLSIPTSSSLHSVFVDPDGGVWSVGGNVLTPALDGGFVVHYGQTVAPLTLGSPAGDAGVDGDAAPTVTCPAAVLAAGKGKSVARRWDEQILAAIRIDLPRPPVHARNLYHFAAAAWDAWAGYDTTAKGVFVREKQTATDVSAARNTAISYAAYGILLHRYQGSPNGAVSKACLRAVMSDLSLDPDDAHDTGNDPIAFGNRIAHSIISTTQSDGSNESANYADPTPFVSVNPPLAVDDPGTKMTDPNQWQPLNLSIAATQNGIVLPAGVQAYVGSQWGAVTPFAMKRAATTDPWHDAGPEPVMGADLNTQLVEVITRSGELDVADGQTMDISPASYGNNTLGANDGTGRGVNPSTGKPYASQVVARADFGRTLAEFWADGPKSETPPGHWNVLANSVADSPAFSRQLLGTGAPLDPLSWDVHVYLALNGAVHDAAITAWDIKRRTVRARPISLIRYMAMKGQSSDPSGPSYDPQGLPLVPGLIEVITKDSSAPGQRHEQFAAFVGQVAIRTWRGEPGDHTSQVSGCNWIRAVDWMPYQRRNFVTPAFPGFISGHSTFSRAAAEVLATLTGSDYFPGGLGSFDVPAKKFLSFEVGPSASLSLQWATYFDAADQAGQSRIWGGIHVSIDDFQGRKLGHLVGLDAVALAQKYFDGSAP